MSRKHCYFHSAKSHCPITGSFQLGQVVTRQGVCKWQAVPEIWIDKEWGKLVMYRLPYAQFNLKLLIRMKYIWCVMISVISAVNFVKMGAYFKHLLPVWVLVRFVQKRNLKEEVKEQPLLLEGHWLDTVTDLPRVLEGCRMLCVSCALCFCLPPDFWPLTRCQLWRCEDSASPSAASWQFHLRGLDVHVWLDADSSNSPPSLQVSTSPAPPAIIEGLLPVTDPHLVPPLALPSSSYPVGTATI